MRYVAIQANAVRRPGRSEDGWVGDVEADSREEAERLPAVRWPGPRLLTVSGTPQHSSPLKEIEGR
jgi:hypothetical protein